MKAPDGLQEAERSMGHFEDIEQLYGDLIPHTFKFGNGMIAKSDKKSVDMRPLWQAVENLKGKMGNQAAMEAARKAVLDAELVYILYIQEYLSLESFKAAMKDSLEDGFLFSPGISADRIRLIGGRYNHIQIRPGRPKYDKYAFMVKTFATPADPSYLEMINERVLSRR